MIPSAHRTVRAASVALSILLSQVACLSTEPPIRPAHGGRMVLFIGNSLTYTNDLPGIVQALADSAKGDSLQVGMVASPNLALIDHWYGGTASATIAAHPWEFVVLQQGPSSVDLNRDTLRLATKLFAPGITAVGARVVMFSAWPTADRRQDYPRAIESYQLAAADVDGLFAPVAGAWQAALAKNPSVGLYDSDGLHPTVAGSYLSALVIYSIITGKSPIGLPSTIQVRGGDRVAVDPTLAAMLRQAASEAIAAAH